MKSVAILVLVAVAGVAALSDRQYQDAFVSWMDTFDKTYAHEEFFGRYNTFKSWVDFVAAHNAGNHTWQAGLNQFSDLTPAQFSAQHLTGLSSLPTEPTAENMEVFTPSNDIDWRKEGAVTPMKNQGQCGSCWAFAAISVVEGWTFLKSEKAGTLFDLSEQQLVDCAGSTGNQGCNGGWHDKAIDYLNTAGGSCEQKDYPYKARNQPCQKTCTPVIKPNKSGKYGTTEAQLSQNLDNGPVGVAVDASGGFQSYHSGVFSGPCGTQLNHAITAVGFSSTPSKYWIVKNSWGTTWGDKGYIHMAQGKNLCGINMHTVWVS
jgi:C1A family cysteine protease